MSLRLLIFFLCLFSYVLTNDGVDDFAAEDVNLELRPDNQIILQPGLISTPLTTEQNGVDFVIMIIHCISVATQLTSILATETRLPLRVAGTI